MEIKQRTQVASTNDWARQYVARGGPLPMAFLAAEQTKGRGTRGNTWISPAGWTYLSIAFAPPPTQATELTLLFAEVVRDILAEKAVGIFWVKPPNDVYRQDEKVAGILLEQTKDALVVGIGIDYPPEGLASRVVKEIESLYNRWVLEKLGG